MRIALFSDVHGNLTALEAVLAGIDAEGCDLRVFAGDLCFIGPRPSECIQRLRDLHVVGVYGNTDEWLLGQGDPPPRHADLLAWTADQLSESDKAWLSSLPFSVTLNPTADAYTGLHIVHANPRDVDQVVYPSPQDQIARFGEIHQTDSDLMEILNGLDAGVMAYGHLHIPSVRQLQDLILVNISSVSLPRDEDPRAKFAMLTWDGENWSAEHFHVPYDPSGEITVLKRLKPPQWQDSVAVLEGYDMAP